MESNAMEKTTRASLYNKAIMIKYNSKKLQKDCTIRITNITLTLTSKTAIKHLICFYIQFIFYFFV